MRSVGLSGRARRRNGSGFAAVGRAFTVELPLAGPVLLAGLRVVAVSTVSLVSVGALIGVNNLGSLFTEGYRTDNTPEILIGVVGIVALALSLTCCSCSPDVC